MGNQDLLQELVWEQYAAGVGSRHSARLFLFSPYSLTMRVVVESIELVIFVKMRMLEWVSPSLELDIGHGYMVLQFQDYEHNFHNIRYL